MKKEIPPKPKFPNIIEHEVTTFPWNIEYCSDEEFNRKYERMQDGRIKQKKRR